MKHYSIILSLLVMALCLGGCNITTQHAPMYRTPVYHNPMYNTPVYRAPVYHAPAYHAPHVRHYRATRSVYQSPYMRRRICVR